MSEMRLLLIWILHAYTHDIICFCLHPSLVSPYYPHTQDFCYCYSFFSYLNIIFDNFLGCLCHVYRIQTHTSIVTSIDGLLYCFRRHWSRKIFLKHFFQDKDVLCFLLHTCIKRDRRKTLSHQLPTTLL